MGSSQSAPNNMPTINSGPLSSFPRHRAPSFGLQDSDPGFVSPARQAAIAELRAELEMKELIAEASRTSWFPCLPPTLTQLKWAQVRISRGKYRSGTSTPP